MPGKRKARLFTELLNFVYRESFSGSRWGISEALFVNQGKENPYGNIALPENN